MKCIKTAQYHDATNNMLYLNFSMVFPMNSAKTAQYHDATNDRFYLQFSWYFLWISQKRLGTTMLHMTRVISFFHGISHEIHQNSSVPWCYKWQDFSYLFMVFSMQFSKTAQYHDATNDRFNLNVSWYFPWISQKQLGTTMLQITLVMSFFLVFHMKITKTAQ